MNSLKLLTYVLADVHLKRSHSGVGHGSLNPDKQAGRRQSKTSPKEEGATYSKSANT